MKNSIRFLFFVCVALLSCTKENTKPTPTADFSFTGAGVAPATITFTNTALNADSYIWDFGDNTSSTDKNPRHTYTTAGTFLVKLTAVGAGGSASMSKSITITKPADPVAAFTFKVNGSAPASVTFTNSSSNASTYNWNFGDAGSSINTSSATNPEHTYQNAGTYIVTLTANGPGGSSTCAATVVINNPTTANFNYSGAGIAPSTVSFSNTSSNATSYSWSFGDILSASNNSSLQNPQHTYAKDGTYTVRLDVSGPGGSSTISRTITVAKPTIAKITQVKVTGMSFTDPDCNCNWDNNSGPDVIYKLENSTGNILANGSAKANVSASILPISWVLPNPVLISNFSSVYKIYLYDEDTNDFPPNADDYIGGYAFTITSLSVLGYKNTILLESTSSSLKIELTVEWL